MVANLRTIQEELDNALDFIDRDDYFGALPILARVVSFAPANALAYELWVLSHIRVGRSERAIQLADEGLARGLPPIGLHLQKSAAFLAMGRPDEAAQAAAVMLAIDPESAEGLQAMAAVEEARGAHDAAIALYQQLVRCHPEDEGAHLELIELAHGLDRHAIVIDSARGYLRKFEKDPDVLAMLGHAYVASNEYRRADRAFRDAANLAPDEIEHHVNVLMLALLVNNEAAFDSYLDHLELRDPEIAHAAEQAAEKLFAHFEEEDPAT